MHSKEYVGLVVGFVGMVILILACLGLISTLGFYSTLSPTSRMVLGGVIGGPCGLVGQHIAGAYVKSQNVAEGQ